MSEYGNAVQNGLVQLAPCSDLASPERRPCRRKRVLLPAVVLYDEGKQEFDCTIRDLSESGARIAIPNISKFPSHFYLLDIRGRIAYDASVAWCGKSEAGLEFQNILRLTDIVDPALSFLKRVWFQRAGR
jgi:hypothetical protein